MMSRLRTQNFTIIGQGVPEIQGVTDTRTNYFSNIDFVKAIMVSWSHPLNFVIRKGKLSYLELLQQPCLSSPKKFQDQRIYESVDLKQTALEVACHEGKVAIIHHLLDLAQTQKIKIPPVERNFLKHRRSNRGQKRKFQNVEIIYIY